MTGYYKAKDKKCKKLCINATLQLVNMSSGVWVSNSELLHVYIRTEKNIYIVDNESQISHCQRKKLQIEKGEEKARMN